MSPPVFSIEAINALLPDLTAMIGEQLKRRQDIEKRLESLGERLGAIPGSLAVAPEDAPDVRERKRDLAIRVERYQAGWVRCEELGGVVKDTRLGLVDFYGQIDGKLVWLCWQYGEDEVLYFHEVDEGFAERKLIEPATRARLLN
ncbi:MAG: DUF2203 domain-containing protein [Myxococcales bacterium]